MSELIDEKSEARSTSPMAQAYVLAAIGFGCMIGWDVVGLFAPATALFAYAEPLQSLPLCTAGLAATALSYFIATLFSDEVLLHRKKLTIGAALCSTCAVAAALLHPLFQSVTPFDIVAWLLFGVSKALLCLLWCAYFSSIPTKHTGVAIGCGGVLGSGIFALSAVAPTEASLLAIGSMPLASSALLLLLFATTQTEPPLHPSTYLKPPSPLNAAAAISLVTHGAAYGFVTFSMCLAGTHAAILVGSSGIIGCALAAIVARMAPKANFDSGIAQRISMPAVIIGLLFMSELDAAGRILCGCLVNSALAFINIAAWDTISTENSEFRLHPVIRFAKRQGPMWAGMFLGALTTTVIIGSTQAEANLLDAFTLFLVVCIVISAAVYGADDSKAKNQLEELLTVTDDNHIEDQGCIAPNTTSAETISFQESCNAVCEQFGLSPREREVFSLLARGRNAKFVQEELCISASTAKTHIYRIYRKMDINSQQLLLDAVDEAQRRLQR